jgi:CheY-like chemotaxis protein
MDGYEVCTRLKSDPETRDIPVIFLTAKTDSEDETRGFSVGAVDYIRKPFSPAVVRARVGTHLALREATGQLERQLSEIQQELEMARKIQMTILPREVPKIEGLEIAARYVPMTSVAGDFYDFLTVDEKRFGFLVADVSGHGVPAALIASMLKIALPAQAANAADPARVLAGLNQALCGKFERHFVTAAYLFVDMEKGTIDYAGAGHPPIILYDRAKRSARALQHNGLFLGMFPGGKYSSVRLPIAAGDRCVVYTDGIAEAPNPSGEEFGLDGLLKIVDAESGPAVQCLRRSNSRGGGAMDRPVGCPEQRRRHHARGDPVELNASRRLDPSRFRAVRTKRAASVRLGLGSFRHVAGRAHDGGRRRPRVGHTGDSLVDPVVGCLVLDRSGGRMTPAGFPSDDGDGPASLHREIADALRSELLEMDLEGVHAGQLRDLLHVRLPQAHEGVLAPRVEDVRPALHLRLVPGDHLARGSEVDPIEDVAADVPRPPDHLLDSGFRQAHGRAVRPDLEDVDVSFQNRLRHREASPGRDQIDLIDLERLGLSRCPGGFVRILLRRRRLSPRADGPYESESDEDSCVTHARTPLDDGAPETGTRRHQCSAVAAHCRAGLARLHLGLSLSPACVPEAISLYRATASSTLKSIRSRPRVAPSGER